MIKKYEEEISKIYENLQNRAKNDLEKRRLEISKKIPEVINIEKQIAKLCINVSINTLKKIENREKYLNNLKEKITDLKIKKSELLVSSGYPMDYLIIKYHCEKCKDTGFVGTIKCTCYKKHLVKIHYIHSEIRDILLKNNFSNFRLDIFDNFKVGNKPDTPRENIKKILIKSKNFISSFDTNNENLFFYGDSGTGKTFLSYCIAKELIDKGFFVMYKTADDLIKNLNEIRFSNNKALEDSILNCDLLIIDDLGTEPKTDFNRSELFNLINKRLLKNKSMIISSNYKLEHIMENYTERITSRLLGNFTLCKFYGEDIRIKQNLKRIVT